ncbi:MAG: CZB domain-containing protein [Gammaproteobacteria bacterium]
MQEIIQKLRKAKQSHKRWVSYASALIEGIPIEKDQVPINYTDCEFGSWYYGDGQALSGLREFKEIEDPHSQLHTLYMQIFALLFNEKKHSLFSKLVGKASKVDEQNKLEAKRKFKQLDLVSKTIVEKLDVLESKLKNMADDEIQKLA